MKANEALYEDKAKMWLKRDKEDAADQGGNKKGSLDYDDDNQVGNDNEAKSGNNKDSESR